MTEDNRIPIDTLRKGAEVLLQHLQSLEGDTVALEWDYYWSIPREKLYDVYNDPSELTVGQLTECLESLDGIIADPNSAVSYGLVWLGDLLRAVGHAVVR